MNILEELDFKNWKLPVEPQQLIMLYLAYKMINKLDTNPFINPPMPRPVVKSVNPSSGIFLIVFFVFVAYFLCSSLIDRVNVSSVFIDDLSSRNITNTRRKCPMKNLGNCPLGKCPLFSSTKVMEENLMKMCPKYNPDIKECKKECQEECQEEFQEECNKDTNLECVKECIKECKKEENSDFS